MQDRFLAPTAFVESTHPAIVQRVASLGLHALTPRERAARLFHHVRGDVRYEFMAKFTRDDYLASNVLEWNRGFCVQKAVLLAALGRAAGVPTAIVLCDMRDRSLSERVLKTIGTDVMFHHGLNAFFVDDRWVVVDASLSPDFLAKKRARVVPFDGTHDALLHATTEAGTPHAEYLKFHAGDPHQIGGYDDLPFEQTVAAFVEGYRKADVSALMAMGLKTS